MTAQLERWRDELRRLGEVRITSSEKKAAMGATLFGLVTLAGINIWMQGEQVPGLQMVGLGTGATAWFIRMLVTRNPRILVTSHALQAFGASVSWTNITQVEVQSARNVVVLRCTDEAHTALVGQLNPLARFHYRLERAMGIRNRFVVPPWLNADARELATWFTELAAPPIETSRETALKLWDSAQEVALLQASGLCITELPSRRHRHARAAGAEDLATSARQAACAEVWGTRYSFGDLRSRPLR